VDAIISIGALSLFFLVFLSLMAVHQKNFFYLDSFLEAHEKKYEKSVRIQTRLEDNYLRTREYRTNGIGQIDEIKDSATHQN